MKTNRRTKRQKRHIRVRKKIFGTEERPRLVVFRSNKSIYAQIIDDTSGKTLACATSKEVMGKKKTGNKNKKGIKTKVKAKVKPKTEIAADVGALLAEKAKKAKITNVVFDRAGYKFHGRVAALAKSAREKGLQL